MSFGEQRFNVVEVDAVADVSSGTYIRALGRDLGEILGFGAHLRMLRRIRVGSWDVARAFRIEDLASRVSTGDDISMIGIDELVADVFATISISADEAKRLTRGMFIKRRTPAHVTGDSLWPAAAMCDGRAIALVSPRGAYLKPDLQLEPQD